MGYIYKITNNINGKCYIGKTERTIQIRWSEHTRLSRFKLDLPLYRALSKYGIDNFSIEEIESCDNVILDEREIYWIDYFDAYKTGYNCTAGGEGGIKTYAKDIDTIIERYLNGERLDQICKEYHYEYLCIKREMEEKGVIVNTFAGPEKLSKKIYAIDPDTLKVVAEYDSISAAGRALCKEGKNPRAIANHISKQKDTQNISHGFLWRTTISEEKRIQEEINE
jgi:group I intron endonuclease